MNVLEEHISKLVLVDNVDGFDREAEPVVGLDVEQYRSPSQRCPIGDTIPHLLDLVVPQYRGVWGGVGGGGGERS